MAITIIAGSFGSGSDTSAVKTITCQPGAAIPVGSTVVVGVCWTTTTRTISSTSDGTSNVYTTQSTQANGTSIVTGTTASVVIGTALTTASTITVTFSNTTVANIWVLGYTGVVDIGPTHNSNIGTTANPSLNQQLQQWDSVGVAAFGAVGTGTFSSFSGKGTLEGSVVSTLNGLGAVDFTTAGPTTTNLGCTHAAATWAAVALTLQGHFANPYENTPLDLGIMTALRM